MKSIVQDQLPENITIKDGRIGYLKKGLSPEQLCHELEVLANIYYPIQAELIFKAVEIIKTAYQSKVYRNYKKADYISSLYISVILSDLTRDYNIVLSGLLYSLYQKYGSFGDTINIDFGSNILSIIKKTLEIEAYPIEKKAYNNGYLNSTILEDMESISILLASFLYNLRTVESNPSDSTKAFGEKTIFYCQLTYELDLFCVREEIYNFLLKYSIPIYKELSMQFREYRAKHIEEIVNFISNVNEIQLNSNIPAKIEIKNGLVSNIPLALRNDLEPQKKVYAYLAESELENLFIPSHFIPANGGIEYTKSINPDELPMRSREYWDEYIAPHIINDDIPIPYFRPPVHFNRFSSSCSKAIYDFKPNNYSIKVQFIVNSAMDCWKTWGIIDSMYESLGIRHRIKLIDSTHNKQVQYIIGRIYFDDGEDDSNSFLFEIMDKKTHHFVEYGSPILLTKQVYRDNNGTEKSEFDCDTFLSYIRGIYATIRTDCFSINLEETDYSDFSMCYNLLDEKYLD